MAYPAQAEEISVYTALKEGPRGCDAALARQLAAHGCSPARMILDRDSDSSTEDLLRQRVAMLSADIIVLGGLQSALAGEGLLCRPPAAVLISC